MAAVAPQVLFISYPKAGRTWLRLMISRYLCDRYAIPHTHLPASIRDLSLRLGLPKTVFDHGRASFDPPTHYTALNADMRYFKDTKVLLLGRDIHDTLVSAWLHLSRRHGIYARGLGEFVRDEYYGAVKFLTFYRQWHENRHVPRAFRFLRYEEMHAAPGAALLACLEYMGVTDVDRDLLEAAVQYGSFDNLRRVEAEQPGVVGFPGRNPQDPESRKIRRGKIGGYVDYMSAEDIAYVDELNRSMGCEFTRPKAMPGAGVPTD